MVASAHLILIMILNTNQVVAQICIDCPQHKKHSCGERYSQDEVPATAFRFHLPGGAVRVFLSVVLRHQALLRLARCNLAARASGMRMSQDCKLLERWVVIPVLLDSDLFHGELVLAGGGRQ